MPINIVERFNQYKIDNSINQLGNTSTAIDYDAPLDFKTWLSYFKDLSISIDTFNSSYKMYLTAWNTVKNTFLINQNDDVKESYIILIRNISIDVYTEQERRFINAVNYDDPEQLDVMVPLVANKIKKITSYYKDFREIIKTQPKKNNIYSSNIGIRSFLYQVISDLLNYDTDTKSLINKYSIDVNYLLENINIVVDDLYDEYDDYFDISNTAAASAYGDGGSLRTSQWSSNTNSWDFDLFLDYNSSVVRLLSSSNYILENFVNNLSVPVALNSTDTKYLKNKDFIDQFNTGSTLDLNLINKKKLFENFSGTDWYYLSTGDSATQYMSGKFLTATNKSQNFLNRNYVSTATVPSTAFLVRSKDIGGYYTPQNLGILQYNTFSYELEIDQNKLQPNTRYYFPDPTKYVATYGNSIYTKSNTVFNVIENAYIINYDIANAAAFGYINDRSYFTNFHGYENLEERNHIYGGGVSRDYDMVEFFKGINSNVWANVDVYNTSNKALFPIDDRQSRLLTNNQLDLVYNTSDIYGNSYGIYNQSTPSIFVNLSTATVDETQKCLFLSNGVYTNSDGTEFDYATTTGTVADLIPGKIFNRSGVTTTQLNFTDNISDTLMQGTFTMPWCFATGVVYRVGNVYDGAYYVDFYGNILPDEPSTDSTSWSVNADVYYNTLIECGATSAGTRPLTPRTASFLYPTVFDTIDCGKFTPDVFSTRSVQTNEYKIPYVESQNSVLSTTYLSTPELTRQSIYSKKYLLSSTPYFRDINNYVSTLSAALSSVFEKYAALPGIFFELNNGIKKFDIVYDIAIIETSNYIVIEKIDYDYTLAKVVNYTDTLTYIPRTTQGDNSIEQFGNFYFSERFNNLLFNRLTLLGVLSASNYKTIYPTFYQYNLDDLKLKEIFPGNISNLFGYLYSYSFRSCINPLYVDTIFNYDTYIYDIYQVDRPSLSYDAETNTYVYIMKATDLSDCMSFFYQTYKFIDGNFINRVNEVYFPDVCIRDENYANPLSASFIEYSSLAGTATSSWIKSENVLKIGE
jgi:hypothetical protein